MKLLGKANWFSLVSLPVVFFVLNFTDNLLQNVHKKKLVTLFSGWESRLFARSHRINFGRAEFRVNSQMKHDYS